ncbi:AAA-ATPase-like protein [Drosera capensis]
MEPELKQAIIDDLDRFVKRKEFYRRGLEERVLVVWAARDGEIELDRGYCEISELDIYDLQLGSDSSDAELRRIMLWTTNKSILVIEDIDCTVEIKNRTGVERPKHHSKQPIIIFTTNHKDKIDPPLLHPGRMDMHIHMSYLTPGGFKTLETNYLGAEQDQRDHDGFH